MFELLSSCVGRSCGVLQKPPHCPLAPHARKQRRTAHLLTDSTLQMMMLQDDDTLQDECGKNWAGTNKQTRKVAVEAICPLMPLPDVLVEYADPRRQRLLAH